VKRLQDETNMLTKELEIGKEKLHTLEAAFERMRKQGQSQSVSTVHTGPGHDVKLHPHRLKLSNIVCGICVWDLVWC